MNFHLLDSIHFLIGWENGSLGRFERWSNSTRQKWFDKYVQRGQDLCKEMLIYVDSTKAVSYRVELERAFVLLNDRYEKYRKLSEGLHGVVVPARIELSEATRNAPIILLNKVEILQSQPKSEKAKKIKDRPAKDEYDRLTDSLTKKVKEVKANPLRGEDVIKYLDQLLENELQQRPKDCTKCQIIREALNDCHRIYDPYNEAYVEKCKKEEEKIRECHQMTERIKTLLQGASEMAVYNGVYCPEYLEERINMNTFLRDIYLEDWFAL